MKNIKSIGWLYDWFTFSSDYVHGMKQKLRTGRNKMYADPGARCKIVWAISNFSAAMVRPKVISAIIFCCIDQMRYICK